MIRKIVRKCAVPRIRPQYSMRGEENVAVLELFGQNMVALFVNLPARCQGRLVLKIIFYKNLKKVKNYLYSFLLTIQKNLPSSQ